MIKKTALLLLVGGLMTGCSAQKPEVFGELVGAEKNPVAPPASRTVSEPPSKPMVQTTPMRTANVPIILQQQEIEVAPVQMPSSSPVMLALLDEADASFEQGQVDESVATIERALRIEPRNALVLYKLALGRFEQGQMDLALNLAKKSELLAEGDRELKRKNWLLIARINQQLGDEQGVQEALQKSQQFAY